jgi:two-component system chemotaxis response regulator CheB
MTTPPQVPASSPVSKRLRILLVDDSPLVRLLLQRILADVPDMEVVGIATNGREGLQRVEELQPDVVITDIEMPVMDGLEFTRQLMVRFPRPVLVVSSVATDRTSERVFSVLQAGAVDVFPKPAGGFHPGSKEAQELVQCLRIVAGVRIFPRTTSASLPPAAKETTNRVPIRNGLSRPLGPIRIVAIGASTGGPQAINTVLSRLPASFPVPLICVQHIGAGFLPGMLSWLAEQTPLPVGIAKSSEKPQTGRVYFAPTGSHLEVDTQGRFQLTDSEPFEGHRPSVNVTFSSLADRFGAACVAILLTGMGRDGAAGIAAVSAHGGWTIAQDEATCAVFGMPRAAIETGQVRQVLPLDSIASTLTETLAKPP